MSKIDWSKIDLAADYEQRKSVREYLAHNKRKKVSQRHIDLFKIDLLWEIPPRKIKPVDPQELDDLIDKMQ